MPSYEVEVDPAELRLPGSRWSGADPYKLQRQIALFGTSTTGMSMPWVHETQDGHLLILNGVTRCTRIAKLAPGQKMKVLVIGKLRVNASGYPKVGDLI